MKIEKLKAPHLELVTMSCDKLIDKKLLTYPMIGDCFSKNNFTVILGKMGQGKSSLMINLVKNIVNKCYENIYVVIPEVSRKSIDNDIFGKELAGDSIYDDLNTSTLDEIYGKVEDNSMNNENSLVIIDDFQTKLKTKEISEKLEKFIIKIRHLHCSVFILQQNFNKLPKNSRQLISNLIFYNIGKSQLQQLFDEVFPLSKTEFQELIKTCFVNPHDWLCLNLRSNKIYKGFHEKIII